MLNLLKNEQTYTISNGGKLFPEVSRDLMKFLVQLKNITLLMVEKEEKHRKE